MVTHMSTIFRACVTALVLLIGVSSTAAQSISGTIAGQVVDAQGQVLPGATVTVTGRTGSKTQTSDETGSFRFLALEPGVYNLKAELSGFQVAEENGIALSISSVAQFKLTLNLSGVAETVQVTANAMVVDTTTTRTEAKLSQDLLFAMPLSRTNAATSLLNYAPGVNSGSAFGGSADSGNALLLDGVDTRDPEGGTAWTFFNFNIVEEVQVGALGQPAEYGGFSGAVVNSITKSGGNRYSSLFEYRYTNKSLRGDNVSADVRRQNATIRASGVDKLNDYTVQLGGPLKKDKAFFFASIQRYAIEQDPDGPRTIRTEVSPRFNVKFTFQPTSSDTLSANVQYDQYNQAGRTGLAGVSNTTDSQTLQQDSPEIIWNGQYRKVLGSSSFFETKFTGWWGYFDLDPVNPASARNDSSGQWSGGAGYSAQYDRVRNQVNASLNRYVKAGGTHNFKFGVEIERSKIRNRYAYSNDLFFYDYGGAPYLAYGYSYDVEGTNKRQSAYAQDQWTIGRFTANIGVRYDGIRGEGSDGREYYNTSQFAPRIGGALDITGRGTSVLRAFYGHLYDGAVFSTWNRAVPGIGDYITYDAFPGNRVVESSRVSGASKYTVADDISHPRTDEFNIAFEQQFRGIWKASATYIQRTNRNFVNSTLIGGQWSPITINNPKTNTPLTMYRWANRASIPQRFLIDNVDSVSFPGAGDVDIYRDYRGVMFVLSRAYANRFNGQVSYVYSKTTGNLPSSSSGGFNSSQFETPNLSLINRDGRVPLDRPHEFKALIGYQIPKVEVALNGYFRALSGTTYTGFTRVSSGVFNWNSANDVFIEPQGTNRNDFIRILDLRVEKVFNAGVNRFGVYADLENALNAGVVTGRNARWPSNTLTNLDGSRVVLQPGFATAVTAPRQITIGARWSF